MTESRFFRLLLYVAAVTAAICLTFRFLLPVLLPFLIGWLLSRLAEPLVRLLGKKLPRRVSSTLVMTALMAVLCFGLYLLLQACLGRLTGLIPQLPALVGQLREPMESLRETLLRLVSRVPDGLGAALREWVTRLFSGTSTLLTGLSDSVLGAASSAVACLPGIFLFLVTAVVSGFMLSAEGDAVAAWLRDRLPQPWQAKAAHLGGHLRHALRGWLRAEVRLMAATFVLVSAGLLVLRVPSPLKLGGLTAVVDALPILGAGTVLIPWAVWSLLQGETAFGIALFVLYGLAAAMRTALEPRLVGRQIGLHPLVTLLAMYAGFRLFGIAGLLLLPIAAVLAHQIWIYGDFGS